MVCCWKGMENLQCGSQNHHVCHIACKPKLKLENDLSKKLQFSTDFSQNFTEHNLTIALPWQQWMSHGTGLYSEFKPISIW